MIPNEFEYFAPATLDEALSLVAGGAKPLAGGMSLIPVMKLRLAAPDQLVDLSRISGLNSIQQDGGILRIGAMTTHYEIESSPLVRAKCPLLAETAAHIGDVQVRNMGTIGGSSAHADPAADYPAALFALGARFVLSSGAGKRTVPASEFFVDTFSTALEPGEIIVEVEVECEANGAGSSYQKMAHPASGYAIVGVAARVAREGGKVTMCRVGVTGLGPVAFRATEVERLLEGTAGTEQDIVQAASAVANGVAANSDLSASAEYRSQMARVYCARALRTAIQRNV